MKLSITFNYHCIVFLSLALLVTPTTLIHPGENTDEIKIEKNKQLHTPVDNTLELLHGEMLFHY